jgi:two-component system cell cycle response regulator CtrA
MLNSYTSTKTHDAHTPGSQDQRRRAAIRRVLLIENDVVGARNLASFLSACAVRVELAETGEDALAQLHYHEFDIVLLSLALPDISGPTMIRELRQARSDVPVIALCSAGKVQARLDAFAAGADDVVEHSINSIELLARMRAIVRRNRGYNESVLRSGSLTLNPDLGVVSVNGNDVELTRTELAILELLIVRRSMVVTREAILAQLYGGIKEADPRVVAVFVCKLRKKLAAAGAPDVIVRVWGRGYVLREPVRGSSRGAELSSQDAQLSRMLRDFQQTGTASASAIQAAD